MAAARLKLHCKVQWPSLQGTVAFIARNRGLHFKGQWPSLQGTMAFTARNNSLHCKEQWPSLQGTMAFIARNNGLHCTAFMNFNNIADSVKPFIRSTIFLPVFQILSKESG